MMILPDDVEQGDLGRWALAGLGPAGRFLLERWSLRRDFPFVAIGLGGPEEQELAAKFRLPMTSDIRELLADPHIDGLILTVPMAIRPSLIRAALSAGKRLLVEDALCDFADEAARLEQFSRALGRSLGVFHVRRSDADFHAARVVVASRRLGTLHSVRWIDCEYSVPAGGQAVARRPSWQDVLASTSPLLFDQLWQLTDAAPLSVQAWSQPTTAGFQARLVYPANLTAWLDVQRASQAGLRTGWVLEGTTGAYRAGRLMTLADDGELREEDVPIPNSACDDVMADLRRLASMENESRASLRRSVQASTLRAAIQQAAATVSQR